MKGFALGLVLTQRRKATRKLPIELDGCVWSLKEWMVWSIGPKQAGSWKFVGF